ncbi:MAG: MBL fold metallo-hydrolase [Herpetosiphon sp.]
MLRVTSLASGSSGNAFLVETATPALLFEAGLSARTLERVLRAREIDSSTLAAIVLSHEHTDHAHGAGPLARKWKIPVICNVATRDSLATALDSVTWLPLGTAPTSVGDFTISGFSVPHDAADPQGLIVAAAGVQVGWALDLGHVPDHVPSALQSADLVIVEANHDRERLMETLYPRSTKIRILSDHGHLSNLQAAELLTTVAGYGRLRCAWLAHLSAQANDNPANVLRIVRNRMNMAGFGHVPVHVAERDRPSAVWHTGLQQSFW